MSANEREWDSLAGLWRADADAVQPMAVRTMLASHRRRLAIVVTGEVVTVAGFVWLSRLSVRDGLEAWEMVWISTLWSFTAIAVPFAWWNSRGTWKAIVKSVAEYRRQRAVRRIRTLRFASGLFVAELLAVSAQLAWFGRLTGLAAVLLAGLTVAFALWAAAMKRYAVREARLADAED